MSEFWCARETSDITWQVLRTLSARHVSLLTRSRTRSRRGNGRFPSVLTCIPFSLACPSGQGEETTPEGVVVTEKETMKEGE